MLNANRITHNFVFFNCIATRKERFIIGWFYNNKIKNYKRPTNNIPLSNPIRRRKGESD